MSVVVVQYNVLSSALSRPDSFERCQRQHLNPENRFVKLTERLIDLFNERALICLQEVSVDWKKRLTQFFQSNGYECHSVNYGNAFTGNMGVLTAFPTDTYRLIAAETQRVSTSDRAFQMLPDTEHHQWWKKFTQLFFRAQKDDGWLPYAKARTNEAVFLRLQHIPTNQTICIGNYHMPCAFELPKTMVAHAALTIQYCQQSAQNDPLIVAGDWNFVPNSSPYLLVTQGKLPSSSPDAIKTPTWTPSVVPMKSAYFSANGQEPDFTNFGENRAQPGTDFVDVLDYIFYSDKLRLVSVVPLPHRSEVKGPFPNETEPSDHVLLSAKFDFQ